MHIFVTLRCLLFVVICRLKTLTSKLKMELKWQGNIYHFAFFFFLLSLLFVLGLFAQIAARKDMKLRKRGFSCLQANFIHYVSFQCATLRCYFIYKLNRWFASIPWRFKRQKRNGYAAGPNKRKWKKLINHLFRLQVKTSLFVNVKKT